MSTTEPERRFPGWVLDALDDNTRRKLILSWRQVPGRGIVVIGADMAEHDLTREKAEGYVLGVADEAGGTVTVGLTGELAEGYAWGRASAACAIHDGQARDGGEEARDEQ
jgi:hypothetical protein